MTMSNIRFVEREGDRCAECDGYGWRPIVPPLAADMCPVCGGCGRRSNEDQVANMTVVEYAQEEVIRQGHNLAVKDGIDRVGWMLNGWSYALDSTAAGRKRPDLHDLIAVGRLVEPRRNLFGLRGVNVRVGTKLMPPCQEVQPMLARLFQKRDKLAPLEFYRELMEIHPFVDGNGRTGKIILAWMAECLLIPFFPPDDFWGKPIRNP